MNQTFKNLSVDPEVTTHIPPQFVALEVVAASSVIAKELAGKDEPDRHHYLQAVPRYVTSLPDSVEAAVAIVKMEAASILNIPGIATDAAKLSEAQAKLATAQAEVETAEAIPGRRLAAIYRHEQELVDAHRELEAWAIDFDLEVAEAEEAIIAFFGKQNVQGRLDDLNRIPILRKLQPKALKGINSRIAEAEAALALLHAPEAARLEALDQPAKGKARSADIGEVS